MRNEHSSPSSMAVGRRRSLRHATGILSLLRYAARSLLRSPVYSLTAIATLGVGIGAATAVAALGDTLLLKPTPFADTERLIYLRQYSTVKCPRCYDLPESSFKYWRETLSGIAELAALRTWQPVWRGRSSSEALAGYEVSGGYFRVLGASFGLGRALSDTVMPDAREVVLTDRLWRARFNAKPDILGSTLMLDGRRHVIVGVLKRDSGYPAHAEVFTQLDLSEIQVGPPTGARFDVFGRLRSGGSLGRAQSLVNSAERRLAAEFPSEMETWNVQVSPIRKWRQDAGPIIVVLIMAVALVLAVACINLTGLLLARFVGLRRELAIRLALGATRLRVAGQITAESLLLSMLGALVGVAIAALILGLVTRVVPADLAAAIPGWSRLGINVRTVIAAAGIGLTVGVLTAVGPVRQIVGQGLSNALRDSNRGMTNSTRIGRLREVFIVAEIALAVVLLVAAGLLARSVDNMRREPLGFEADQVLAVSLQPGWSDQRDRPDFHVRLVEVIESVPGVSGAATVSDLPLSGSSNFVSVGNASGGNVAEFNAARLQNITADYFETMGIRVLRGQAFSGATGRLDPRVAIVNEAAAQRFGGDVLGRTVPLSNVEHRIIGVVSNVRHDGVRDIGTAEIYVLERRDPVGIVNLVVRLVEPADVAAPRIMEAIRRYDPDLAPVKVETMRRMVATSLAPFHLTYLLMVSLAAFAMLISSVGLYGLISYVVGQRRREFGIRMALGARPVEVVFLVLRRGMLLTTCGAALGIIGAIFIGRLLAVLLFGLDSYDPMTLLTVAGGVGAVAILASYLPARAATQVTVVESLQVD